ncbi:unnamed protein product [Effrenium voratum]|nr:unnamed protein product [Effrenium voratum]
MGPEYTQLLQACARSTHPERREVAARLLRQMSADGLSPDEATLQMLQPLRPARPRGADSSEKAGQASASASTLAEMLHSAGAKKRHRETGETETAKVLQELVEELGD